MPPARQPDDPFADGALRATNSNAAARHPPVLRNQPSHHSLRSAAASTTSTRSRQQRDLFAPTLSRRPTSRATPRIEDDVLADSNSEQELELQRRRRLRSVRHASPVSRLGRSRQRQEEDVDIVNRRPDGGYIQDIAGQNDAIRGHLEAQELADEARLRSMDDQYAGVARQYFTSGVSLSGRGSRKHDEEYEEFSASMMFRLREQVMQRLEDERWRYEPTNS